MKIKQKGKTLINLFLAKLVFFRQYLANIRQIGSLMPSSNTLGFYMSEQLLFAKELEGKIVVELGGGDGVLSVKLARILAHAKNSKLFVIEINPVFASTLRQNLQGFENAHVLEINAASLKDELLKLGVERVDFIFSCLPFLSLEKGLRARILKEILLMMGKDSIFVMFSYTKLLLKQLKANFKLQKSSLILANFPPAYIFSFTRYCLPRFCLF